MTSEEDDPREESGVTAEPGPTIEQGKERSSETGVDYLVSALGYEIRPLDSILLDTIDWVL